MPRFWVVLISHLPDLFWHGCCAIVLSKQNALLPGYNNASRCPAERHSPEANRPGKEAPFFWPLSLKSINKFEAAEELLIHRVYLIPPENKDGRISGFQGGIGDEPNHYK